jgi:hypothetical protein
MALSGSEQCATCFCLACSEGFHEVPPLLDKDKARRPSLQLHDPGSRGSLGEPEADFNLARSPYYLMVCVSLVP